MEFIGNAGFKLQSDVRAIRTASYSASGTRFIVGCIDPRSNCHGGPALLRICIAVDAHEQERTNKRGKFRLVEYRGSSAQDCLGSRLHRAESRQFNLPEEEGFCTTLVSPAQSCGETILNRVGGSLLLLEMKR
jgi:hypothetical protein